MDGVDERQPENHRVAAVRAHLLGQAGDLDGAITDYRRAAALTTNLAVTRSAAIQAPTLRASSEPTPSK